MRYSIECLKAQATFYCVYCGKHWPAENSSELRVDPQEEHLGDLVCSSCYRNLGSPPPWDSLPVFEPFTEILAARKILEAALDSLCLVTGKPLPQERN